MPKSYEKIKKDIVEALYWDSRVDATDVTVFVQQGQVRLTGDVPTYPAKQAAESAAWSVPEVNAVNNQIRVRTSQAHTPPGDEKIQAYIQDLFVWNPNIQGNAIKVGVSEGVVKLTGRVDHYWKCQMAAELASLVEGVVEIINDISVAPAKSVLDKAIGDRIRTVLAGHPQTRSEAIEVNVEHGRVRLAGFVHSQAAYHIAGRSALHLSGVVDVDNHLRILSESGDGSEQREGPEKKRRPPADQDTFQRLARAEDDGFPVARVLENDVADYHTREQ